MVVPDYAAGEGTDARPYLRFGPDGTVEVNERSVAAAANESRYGTDRRADRGRRRAPLADAWPRDGRYVWHDHRIHWMLAGRPTAVGAGGAGRPGRPRRHLDRRRSPSTASR